MYLEGAYYDRLPDSIWQAVPNPKIHRKYQQSPQVMRNLWKNDTNCTHVFLFLSKNNNCLSKQNQENWLPGNCDSTTGAANVRSACYKAPNSE